MRCLLAVLVFALFGCPRGGAVRPPDPDEGNPKDPPAEMDVVESWKVISSERESGTFSTTTARDGTITTSLFVLENGRGPAVDATVRLGADGTIASLQATGHHEMGTPVDETFALTDGRATWTSPEEHGEAVVEGSTFFVPMSEIPIVGGWLVQAALANGGTIALLPGGEARIEKVGEMVVSAGGKTRTIVGYVVTGLSLGGDYAWMNPDGTWFGTFSPWFSVVPVGWEDVIDPIVDKQRDLDSQADAALAAATAHRPPDAGIAYQNARVLDVVKGKWLAGQTVLVKGDTIVAVGKKVKVPKGAEVVDLAGKALIPGLVDMHAHLDGTDGRLNIAYGVTTVRDVGNDPDALDDLKARWDAGEAIGPSVVRFGFIEGRGEKAASSIVTAETEDEARAAVEYFEQRGYEGIKIYNSVKVELVPLLAKLAHDKGMMVTGHIPVHMLAHEAVDAGYDGIEHINMLFLNFLATHETDTRTTQRFLLVGHGGAGLDLGSKEVKEFVALLKQRGTVVDPTLAAFEDLLSGEAGKITPGLEDEVASLPVQTGRGFLLNGMPITEEERATFRTSYDQLLAMVKLLHDAGVVVVTGTDHIAGVMLHHELELFSRAGIANADILRMATIDAARAMKMDKRFGTIAKGQRADLVVVDGDPLNDIADARNVVSTMRAGVVYESAPLLASVGIRR